MSNSIDERIVEMRFNNKQFESGIENSLSSIDSLKKGLTFDQSEKNLSNLEKAGKSFSMASLVESVENISSKFTMLGIIGVTALQNITNSAVNAGKKIVSALTIDPVKTGFSEYETQINAIQTVLANTSSKGTTLTDVNKALGELNTYADKTIYNFTEMTRNIGTFTAAGIDLDTSVAAIKGIANLAAVSGSTSQQASTAMYQLSQALASGTVKLMDWNSVVNAGMGGEVFQDALKDTARVHGIAVDKMIDEEGSFRETLKNGWLTSEVLTQTLSKFTGDLNEDQLKTMGYTKEQITAIVKMGKTANDAATKVKTFSQLWDTLKEGAQSGWTQTWELIVGDFEEAKATLTIVSDTIGGIIGASADARNAMLKDWKALGGRTALIETITNAFEGIGSVIAPIKEAFRGIFPPMTGERLFAFTEGLRKLTERFKIGDETADKLKRTFKGVFAIVDIGIQLISALAKGFGKLVGFFMPAGDGLLSVTARMGDYVVGIRDAIKESDAFNKIIEKISTFLAPVGEWIKNFVTTVAEAFKEFATIDTSAFDSFSEKIRIRFEPFTKLGELFKKTFKVIGKVVEKVAPIFSKLAEIFGKALGKLQEVILNAMENLEFDGVFDIINGGLLAAVWLAVKKFIGDASGVFAGISDILDGVKGSLEAWQQSLKANTLLKIAGAMAILTASVIALSFIDSEKLTTALTALTVMFAELFGSMAIFEKIMGSKGFKGMGRITRSMILLSIATLILSFAVTKLAKLDWDGMTRGLFGVAALSATLVISAKSLSKASGKLIKGSLGLIAFAVAINILADAVIKLSAIDTNSLTRGLVGVGVLCAELALFLKTADLDGMGIGKGLGFIALAFAINLLATAVGKFAEMDTNAMLQGLAGVGIVLMELAIFTKLTGNAKKVISAAIGLTILGAAMLIFASAIEKMGGFAWEVIGKGLLTMAGALAAVTIAVNLMPKGMIAKALGMIGIATALLILASALNKMGSMSWEEIGKSLVTLAGSLTIIALAMTFMTGALPGAAALLIIAASLAIIAPILMLLGSMSLSEIGKGLLALAGVFAVFGVAGLVLAPLTPVLLALGAAITLFGVGCLAVGAGVLAFSAGLTALSIAGTAGAAALVLIVTSIISLIPMILEQLALGIVGFVKVIGDGVPVIMEAVTKILLAVIQTVIDVTPKVIECIMVFLKTLLKSLADAVPEMVDSGMKLILGILEGIAANIKDVVEAGIDVIVQFLLGVASKLPDIIDTAFKVIISFINGLADAIRENDDAIIDAVINLVDAITGAIGDLIWRVFDVGKDIVKGLIEGIKSMFSAAWDAVTGFFGGLVDGVKDFLGINSPSRVFMEIGEYSGEGFIDGFSSTEGDAMDAANNLGSSMLTELSKYENPAFDVSEDLSDSTVAGLEMNKNEFGDIGEASGDDYVLGLADAKPDAEIAGSTLATNALEGIKSQNGSFRQAGLDAGKNFSEGLKSYSSQSATQESNYDAGKNAGEAYSAGLTTAASKVPDSSDAMNDVAVSSIKDSLKKVVDTVEKDVDTTITITPVIDLGKAADDLKKMNDMAKTVKFSSANVDHAAAKIAEEMKLAEEAKLKIDKPATPNHPTSYSFNQYNYSPKALSRVDIYRQTNNQLSLARGVM